VHANAYLANVTSLLMEISKYSILTFLLQYLYCRRLFEARESRPKLIKFPLVTLELLSLVQAGDV
jgi:hypothetical protein